MVLNRNDKRKKKEGDLVDLMEPLSESPKRTKVHAQRKFAQGASTSAFNTSPTPAKDKEKAKPSQITELITHKRPNTEDFLTFLCFRGTSILPPSLDFFNYSATKNNLTPKSSTSVPVHDSIDKLLPPTDAAPGTSKQEMCQKNVTKVKPVVPVKKKIPSTIHKNISKLKTATSTVQALKKKYQEQRLAKQRIENKLKATCVMRTRSCTERTTLSTEVKLAPEKYLPRIETKRHGLRSGLLLDKTNKLLPKTKDAPSKPKRKINLKSKNSDTSNTDESSEEEDNEEENEVNESQSEKIISQVKRNIQKSIQKKICTRSKSDLRRVTRSYSGTISPKNLSTRPTRKTKEAAAMYMEILGRKLVSPEVENDDNISIESFLEMSNTRKIIQTESDIKAKVATKQTTAKTVNKSKDLKVDSDNGNKRSDKNNTDKMMQLKSKRIIRVQRYYEEDSEEESESSVEMNNTRPITRQSLGKLDKSADRSNSRSLRSSSKNTPILSEEPSIPNNKPKAPVQNCVKPVSEKLVMKRKRDQNIPKTSSDKTNGPKPKSLKIDQNEDVESESEEETLGMLLSKMKKKKESNEEKEQIPDDVSNTKDDAAKPNEAKMDLSKVSDDEESFRGFTKKAISKVLDSCQTHANVNLLVGEKLNYAKMLDMTETDQSASSQKHKEETSLVKTDTSTASLSNDECNRAPVHQQKSTLDSSLKTHDSSSTGHTSKKCNHEDEVSPDLIDMPLSTLHTRKERVNMSTERIEKWLNENSLVKEESKLEMENVSIFRYDSTEKLKTDVSHLSIPTKIQHLVRPVNVTLSKLMDKTSLKDRLKMLNKNVIPLKSDVHTIEAKPPVIVTSKNNVYTDTKPSVSLTEDNDTGKNKVCTDVKLSTSIIEDNDAGKNKACTDVKPCTLLVEENDSNKDKICTEAKPSTSLAEDKDTSKNKICTDVKPSTSLTEENSVSKLDQNLTEGSAEKKPSTEKKIFQLRKSFLPKFKERKTVTPNANAFSPENESSVYAFESDTEVPVSTPFRRKVKDTAINKPVMRSIMTLNSKPINKPVVRSMNPNVTLNPKPTAVVPAVTSTVTSAAASTSRSAATFTLRSAAVSSVESTVAFTRTSTVTSTVTSTMVSTVASAVIPTVTSTVTSTSKTKVTAEVSKPIVEESPDMPSNSEQSTSTTDAPAMKNQEITAEPIIVADTTLDLNKFNLGIANIQVLPLNTLMTNWSNDSSSIEVQVNLGERKQEQQTGTDKQEDDKQENDKQAKDKQGKDKQKKDSSQQKSTEISTQTDNDETNNDEEQLFYIPLQAITRSGPNLQRRQVIQGVAVKLDTEGRVGSNQRVLLRAKLVTKSPLSIAHHPTPVGTVQPTTRAPPSSASQEQNVSSALAPSYIKVTTTTVDVDCGIASAATTIAPTKMIMTASTKTTTPAMVVATTSSMETRPISPAKSDVSNSTRSSVNNSLEKLRRSPKSSRERKASVDSAKSGKRARYKLKGSESSTSNNTTCLNIKDAYDELDCLVSCVPEAPTFHPSEKEFLDPMEYINKIRPTAEKFGICKVVPPANFKPECKVSDDMRFTAYNQYVHRMLYRWGPNVKELMAIKKYLATQSITLSHPPWIGGMEVDLPHLYQTVQSLGGLKEVIEKKKWQKVADGMKIPKSAQDRVTKLDDIYCKYLLPYDTLSPEEREKLFDEVEEEWLKKESKALERQETSSTDNDEEEEEDESSDEIEECIVKGRNMPLNAFYRIARNTQRMWFGENQRGGNETEGASALEVASAFWRHVVERKRHVCVHAASIDSSGRGFGFPVAKNSPFARHSWNLKVLTNNAGSVLRALGPVMGVTVPTLHVGMLFSACCWYRDPHGLPWIEYLHTGAKKIWYGIPDKHNNNFREALSKMVPQYCKNKTIWLPSDTAMVPPKLLLDNDVSLCQTVQEPGQFIIVFPKAFTSSICTGYVVSESVYFAQPSWLETAEQVFKDIQDSCEPSIFSFEKLLFNIINDPRYTQLDILKQILPSVLRIHNRELEYRKQLEDLGLNKRERVPLPGRKKEKKGKKVKEDDDDYECETCRANLFVSMVTNTQENTFYCLPHALELLNRKKQLLKHCVLMYTYNEDELDKLIKKLEQKIEAKTKKTNQNKQTK